MLDQKNKLPQLTPEPEPEPEIEVPPPKEEEVFKMPHKAQTQEDYTTTPDIPTPKKPKSKKQCSPQLLEHLKKAREKSLATRKRNKELKLQAKKNIKAKEKEEVNKLKMEIAEEPLKEPEQKIEMDENRRIIEDVSTKVAIKEKPKQYKNTHNSEMIDYEKIIMGVSDRLLSQLDEVPEPSKPIPIPQEPKMEKILRGTPTFTPEHPQQYEQHIRQQERNHARDYYEKLYNDKNNKAIATNVISRNSSYPRLNNKNAYSDDIWEKCFRN